MPTMPMSVFQVQERRNRRIPIYQDTSWPLDFDESWNPEKSLLTQASLRGAFMARTWNFVQQHREQVQAWRRSAADDVRAYSLPVSESFQIAVRDYPAISVNPNVMGGAPCVDGTRIPVYMILDAVEHHGSPEGALESYPNLTVEQVKDAIGFAKIVVECPLGDDES